jgi:hypothetical protein
MLSPANTITHRTARRNQKDTSTPDRVLRHRSNVKPLFKTFLPIFVLVSFIFFALYMIRMYNRAMPPQDGMLSTDGSTLRSAASMQTDFRGKAENRSIQSQEKSFLESGMKTGTDKVLGLDYLPGCLKHDATCTRPSCLRENCRPFGHFYQTMYQQRLGKYTLPSTEPFQFLEIGHFNGRGYQAYQDFFSEVNGAELHSMEISCIPEGPREKGLWPWGNFANASKDYEMLLEKKLLHCGDASNVTWLDEIYSKQMRRPDAPPLKIVVDDGSHLSSHMVTSMFFWFPRIEPGGLLIMEDIQPIVEANLFRTQFLPQIMSDLHFCGDPKEANDEACFPQLYPYLQSIHCEMHICVFERNQKAAVPDLSLEMSTTPANALDLNQCYSLTHPFGTKA